MKRSGKKALAGGIVALSLILTGTGYAYWTDTLNVTTKATTGEFDVTFADLGLYAQYSSEVLHGGWSIVDGIDDAGYVDDGFFTRGEAYNKIAKDGSIESYQNRSKGFNDVEFDAELVDKARIKKTVGPYVEGQVDGSDNILLTVKNMYPGYAQAFRTDILNVGSIAAKLGNMKFDVKAVDGMEINDTTRDMLGIALMIDQEAYNYNTSDHGKGIFKLCKSLADETNSFKVGEVDFLRLSALDKLSDEEIKAVITESNLLCAPDSDNRMDLFIAVAMDPDAEGVYTTGSTDKAGYAEDTQKDALSQDKGVAISVDLLWDQFNAGKDSGNANWLSKQNIK